MAAIFHTQTLTERLVSKMARKATKFRQIKPESIRLDDLIRCTATQGGVQRSRTGVVKQRTVFRNNGGVEFATAEGGVLLTVFKDGSTDMFGTTTVTLISRVDTDTLPGLGHSDTL